MKNRLNVYYDKKGDFLEITIINPPGESYCEDVSEDVFLRKDEDSHGVIGLGILNFKTHAKDIKEILANVPVKINFETTNIAS